MFLISFYKRNRFIERNFSKSWIEKSRNIEILKVAKQLLLKNAVIFSETPDATSKFIVISLYRFLHAVVVENVFRLKCLKLVGNYQ